MARTVTIPLSLKLTDLDGQTIEAVVLAEPRAKDFFELGEPWTTVRRPDHSMVVIENQSVIEAYFQRLVKVPESVAVLNALPLVDAIAVKDALLGFFVEAREKASRSSVTPLSSAPDLSTPLRAVN